MIVLPNREKFIKENFFELSFKDEKPNFEKFKTLNSTELHFLAEIYNWDDGIELLNWIIESEKCDKGTASMIFWRSVPDYYLEKNENDIQDYEKDIFNLINKVIQKFKSNNFNKSSIKYDPNEDFDFESYKNELTKWNLPSNLTISTKGIKPIYIGTTFKFLKNQLNKSKKRRRRR